MKEIAVLLTVFNRKNQTLRCLSNLYSQKLPNDVTFDVFLTNDGCTDGTPEAVKEQFPNVHIIDGDGTLYWNRGMWTAWNVASQTKDYDYFLWLNDDTFLYEKSLSILVEASKKKNEKSIIVGCVQNFSHSLTTYGGYNVEHHVESPDGTLKQVFFFNGNIILIPAYVFAKVGNLDYFFHHCQGDFDYGLRANKNGVNSYISPSYVGECERHSKLAKWCNPDVPFIDRIQSLKSPLSYSPSEAFHFEKRHHGLIVAIFHQLTLYLRVCFPSLWVKIGKARI